MVDTISLRKTTAPQRMGTTVVTRPPPEAKLKSPSVAADAFESGLTLDAALPAKTLHAIVTALSTATPNKLFSTEIHAFIRDGGPYPLVSADSPPDVVREIKHQLARAGFDVGPLRGPGSEVYGPEAQKALQTFQTANNLPMNSMVGAETWAELKQQRFSRLSPESQVQLIEQLSKHPTDAEARSIISSVALCAGFRSLDADQQRRLLIKIGGGEPIFAGAIRQAIRDESLFRVVLNEYLPERQATALKDLVDQPYIPRLGIQDINTLLDDSKGNYRILGPSTTYLHKFVGGWSSTAHKYEIVIGDRRVPVFVSPDLKKNGKETLSIEQIAQGLSSLPKVCMDLVKGINLEGEANPDDAHFAEEYKTGSFKSYMSSGSNGVINIFPSEGHDLNALNEVFAHEIGHILSDGAWGQWHTAAWKAWDRAAASDDVFVSQYAKKSRHEDFAEVFVTYIAVKGTDQEVGLRSLMPGRFALIDQLVKTK